MLIKGKNPRSGVVVFYAFLTSTQHHPNWGFFMPKKYRAKDLILKNGTVIKVFVTTPDQEKLLKSFGKVRLYR